MKDSYLVTQVGNEQLATFTQVGGPFSSTRESIKWIKNFGGDGIAYAVIKITKVVEVETVSTKKIRDRSNEQ